MLINKDLNMIEKVVLEQKNSEELEHAINRIMSVKTITFLISELVMEYPEIKESLKEKINQLLS